MTRCEVLFPILLELNIQNKMDSERLTAAVWRKIEFRVSKHSFSQVFIQTKSRTNNQGYLEKSYRCSGGTMIRGRFHCSRPRLERELTFKHRGYIPSM